MDPILERESENTMPSTQLDDDGDLCVSREILLRIRLSYGQEIWDWYFWFIYLMRLLDCYWLVVGIWSMYTHQQQNRDKFFLETMICRFFRSVNMWVRDYYNSKFIFSLNIESSPINWRSSIIFISRKDTHNVRISNGSRNNPTTYPGFVW